MVQDSQNETPIGPVKPVFLERQTYRRRRLMDGVRILPVLGAALWMIPVLWPTGHSETAEPLAMSAAMTYIFSIWLLLIVLSWMVWFWTRTDQSVDLENPPAPLGRQNGPD